jgi:toxin YhaV
MPIRAIAVEIVPKQLIVNLNSVRYDLLLSDDREGRVFVWVNDENSKRAYQRKTDAYRVFQKMLNGGYPPDDWDDLSAEV